MFTGLIEEIGAAAGVFPAGRGGRLQITAPTLSRQVREGASVAVNGCCLTVTAHSREQLAFDLLGETLARTNLGALASGSRVNLERALAADGRIGGHFVQGHVDCAARVLSFQKGGADHRLEVELPAEFAHLVAPKGSVALDGISLTIAEILPHSFVTWIIPHTWRQTNLQSVAMGDRLNVEFDLLAKYVERMSGRLRAGE